MTWEDILIKEESNILNALDSKQKKKLKKIILKIILKKLLIN